MHLVKVSDTVQEPFTLGDSRVIMSQSLEETGEGDCSGKGSVCRARDSL